MKIIVIDEAPVLPEQSEFVNGMDKDLFKLKRKWTVRCSPRLEFDEGESSSEWSTVARILSGISWCCRIQICMKKRADANGMAANFLLEDDNKQGYRQWQKLVETFMPNYPGGAVTVQLGDSNSINFLKGFWHGPDVYDSLTMCDVQLSNEVALKLTTARDEDIRVTCNIFIRRTDKNVVDICKRILGTGFCSDLKIFSSDGYLYATHKVVLTECSSKLRGRIGDDTKFLKLNISSRTVTPFLAFLYHGGLDEVHVNLQLTVELMKAAGSYDVPKLWEKAAGILLDKEVNLKTAFAIFGLIVKLKKLESTNELARKLAAQIFANSRQISDVTADFMMYFKNEDFVSALFGLHSSDS